MHADLAPHPVPITPLMVQMLTSKQLLILMDKPYFNEPGYEGTMHTSASDSASRDYNRNIRCDPVRAFELLIIVS